MLKKVSNEKTLALNTRKSFLNLTGLKFNHKCPVEPLGKIGPSVAVQYSIISKETSINFEKSSQPQQGKWFHQNHEHPINGHF